MYEKYDPIIKNVLKKFNNYNNKDLEQELWVKVLEIFPDLEKVKSQDIMRIGKVILKNHLIDVLRIERRWTERNVFVEDLDKEINPYNYSPFDVCSYNELKTLVRLWNKNRDEITQNFINELLRPSERVLDVWESKVKETNRYKSYFRIPPYTLSRILGISKRKYNEIMMGLRNLLIDYQYSV